MRWNFLILAAPVLAAPSARAQVSVNMNALDQLSPGAAGTRAAMPSPGAGVTRPAPAKPVSGPLPLPPTPPSAPPPPAPYTITGVNFGPLPSPPPKHPPPAPILAPIVLVGPPHPEPPPAPPHVVDGAPGTATRIPDGLRVTFGADDAALNPVTLAALRQIAGTMAEGHARAISVDAYAKSDPSDPSTARRLSLSRALAARAVLREAGIPSEQIYVRALLANATGHAPPDRVDVTFSARPKGSP
jgi:outer membrane protein OmpA-like peptidoglycan-associated protein